MGLALNVGQEIQVSQNSMISIVDHNSSVREALKDLIRAMGFAVETFPCAEDFLVSGLVAQTGCLITDMRMPGIRDWSCTCSCWPRAHRFR